MINWISEINAIKTELIASGATACFVFFGRSMYIKIKNMQANRRHRLTGDYITYYVDKTHDEIVTKKATLRIQQMGLKFVAYNRDLDGGREWELRGDILPNGYLAGNYGHLNPKDPSKGTFFMEADVTQLGNYKGHWAGYDSINKEIASGSYIWRKTDLCKIRTLTTRDRAMIDQILGVFSDALGARFIKKDRIEKAMANREQSGMYIQAAYHEKKVVGVRTLKILNEEEKATFQKQVREYGGSCSIELDKMGMLASNAVAESWRRKGVGSQLVESGLNFLRKKGCTACVAVSWQSGEIDSSASILEAFGFRKLATAKNYWKEESIRCKN